MNNRPSNSILIPISFDHIDNVIISIVLLHLFISIIVAMELRSPMGTPVSGSCGLYRSQKPIVRHLILPSKPPHPKPFVSGVPTSLRFAHPHTSFLRHLGRFYIASHMQSGYPYELRSPVGRCRIARIRKIMLWMELWEGRSCGLLKVGGRVD